MVAEDGSMFRAVLTRLLHERGYDVETAPDGASALARLTSPGPRPFDLLIADVVMPSLGGRELVERMRQRLPAPPPVVFMSGDVRPAPDDPPGTLGGDPILSKPFAANDLFAAIEGVLAAPGAGEAPSPPC